MYLMIICSSYGEMDCSQILEAWVPMAYTIAMQGKRFNVATIISRKLSIKTVEAQNFDASTMLSFFYVSIST